MTVRYLSSGELQRLRYELGANLLEIGAEPYVDHLRIFDVIQDNLVSDEQDATECATTAATAGPNTLTLTSVTGISALTRLVLDVDDSAEVVTVKKVTGSTVLVNTKLPHTATYPVEIESGLTIVRMLLWQLASIANKINESTDFDGIKQVDEVVFQDTTNPHMTVHSGLLRQQQARREELASAVNLQAVLAGLGFGRRRSSGRLDLY